MKSISVAIALGTMILTSATAVAAEGLPPGKWWNRPEVVKKLALTPEQRGKLDEVFRASAPTLIDMKGDVEKKTLDLREQLDKEELNRQAIQTAAARLNEARGRLFERELMMLVDMRGILTPPQWNRFRDTLERRDEGRMGPPGGPMGRPPAGQQNRPRRPRM